METRELYRQKYEAQLTELDARVDVLKARSEQLTAQAKIDMQPHVEAVQERYGAVKARLADIAAATDEKWHELKAATETAWNELKGAVEGGYDALTTHTKA